MCVIKEEGSITEKFAMACAVGGVNSFLFS